MRELIAAALLAKIRVKSGMMQCIIYLFFGG